MKGSSIRVVKMGGSLLDLVDLSDRLRRWLAMQAPAHHVLVVGGGPLVEQVRRWHESRPMDVVAAHWLCIDLMAVTARLLHARMPEVAFVEDHRQLRQPVGERSCTIFGPANWMRHDEPSMPGTSLPASWEVTSDAIAARLAIVLDADELILLKSTLPEKGATSKQVDTLAAAGFVDRMFVRLARELPACRIVDLRSDRQVEMSLPISVCEKPHRGKPEKTPFP